MHARAHTNTYKKLWTFHLRYVIKTIKQHNNCVTFYSITFSNQWCREEIIQGVISTTGILMGGGVRTPWICGNQMIGIWDSIFFFKIAVRLIFFSCSVLGYPCVTQKRATDILKCLSSTNRTRDKDDFRTRDKDDLNSLLKGVHEDILSRVMFTYEDTVGL